MILSFSLSLSLCFSPLSLFRFPSLFFSSRLRWLQPEVRASTVLSHPLLRLPRSVDEPHDPQVPLQGVRRGSAGQGQHYEACRGEARRQGGVPVSVLQQVLPASQLPGDAPHLWLCLESESIASRLRLLWPQVLSAAEAEGAHKACAQR